MKIEDELGFWIGHHEFDKVKSELDKGIDINYRNKDGLSYLHIATINYDLDLVKLLIERGCEVDGVDNKNKTALMYSLGNRHNNSKKIAKYLIDNGANLDLRGIKYTPREMIEMFKFDDLKKYIEEKENNQYDNK